MLLRKRARQPIKRTTSMTEFTLDLNNIIVEPSDPFQTAGGGLDQRPMPSPSSYHQNSADFVETAPFLKSCFLCKRRLIPGRDIYIYRGDSAFCSVECRQQQMTQDERREKYSMMSKKEAAPISGVAEAVSGKAETVAAGM